MITMRELSYTVSGRILLHDIDLTVDVGELVAVVGPNGAGKSTLLRILAGQLTPERGTVELDGFAPASMPTADLAVRLAYLGPRLNQDMLFTAREVVAMGRFPHRHRPTAEQDNAAIQDAVDTLDLGELLESPMNTLSTGEAQRVGIARTLTQMTPVALLDEPTAALDLSHQVMTMDALRRRADAGTAVVCVLHDLNQAARSADRLLLLHEGSVAAMDRPDQVLDAHLLTSVYNQPITVIEHPTTGQPLVVV